MTKADVLEALGPPTVKEEVWTYRRSPEARTEVLIEAANGHTDGGIVKSHETTVTFSNDIVVRTQMIEVLKDLPDSESRVPELINLLESQTGERRPDRDK